MPLGLSLKLPHDSATVQSLNKARWNKERAKQHADFYTIGYSGRDITTFVELIRNAGVSTVVDVRQYPVSMYKPEFSKSNLRGALEGSGVQYIHRPLLGVPREVRASSIGKANRDDIWLWYDANVVAKFIRNLHDFFNAAEHPVALLCVEADPTACHRHRLALALERKGLHGFDL
ncbi:MAG: DUF488 domain-containing protein [Dehalococcoidia bacterium]|nr:DUF488 domain-containing protein [Dehalococcoidia bacterium]